MGAGEEENSGKKKTEEWGVGEEGREFPEFSSPSSTRSPLYACYASYFIAGHLKAVVKWLVLIASLSSFLFNYFAMV